MIVSTLDVLDSMDMLGEVRNLSPFCCGLIRMTTLPIIIIALGEYLTLISCHHLVTETSTYLCDSMVLQGRSISELDSLLSLQKQSQVFCVDQSVIFSYGK